MVATAPAREGEIIEHQANPHTIVIDEQDEKKAIQLMDRIDLDQAMAEIRGEIVEQFVYIVPGKGNRPPKQQLSYVGVKEAARLYKNVKCGAKVQQQASGDWLISAWAANLADNFSVDEYPAIYPAFNIGDKNAQIEFRAHVSKALRNALMVVLPISYLNKMIEEWLKQQGRGPQVPQGPRVAQLPPRPMVPPQNPPDPESRQISTPRDTPEIAALRTELAEWYERYPDRKTQVDAYLQQNGWDRLGAKALTTEVQRMRQRAADEEAQRQDAAQEAAVTDPSPSDELAGALEVTRNAVEALSKKKGGPNAGDYEGMRVVLRELQRCDPLPDDTPPEQIPPRLLLDALRTRLAVADAGGGEDGARAVKEEIDEAIPF